MQEEENDSGESNVERRQVAWDVRPDSFDQSRFWVVPEHFPRLDAHSFDPSLLGDLGTRYIA